MFTEAERILTHQVQVHRSDKGKREVNVADTYKLNDVAAFVMDQRQRKLAASTEADSAAATPAPALPQPHRAGLQFPDQYLSDAPLVVEGLQKLLTKLSPDGQASELYVLADTTFGSCCVDEVTAQHCGADCIVHFGYACMCQTNRVPVHYVIPKWPFDAAVAATQLLETVKTVDALAQEQKRGNKFQIVVVCAVDAVHGLDDVKARFAAAAEATSGADNVLWAQMSEECPEGHWHINGLLFPRVTTDSPKLQVVAFLGATDSPMMPQLAMIAAFNSHVASTFVPEGGASSDDVYVPPQSCFVSLMGAEEGTVHRTVARRLQQRAGNIERLKAADSIGILVASLSIVGYRETVELLKTRIRGVGKRCYVLYIGHLNEFKLANFVDSIDIFVVVACPTANSCQFPTKDDNYMRPVVSPMECLVALGSSSDVLVDPLLYTTTFTSALPLAAKVTAEAVSENDKSSALMLVGGGGTVTTAGQRLQMRSYTGLEPKVGETAVQSELVEGKSGIAKGYAKEKEYF